MAPQVESLDAIRIPDALLGNRQRYLDPFNFATNFVFFRDAGGLSTRLVTANYWAGYGAREVALWLMLFDEGGNALAEWREPLGPGLGSIVIDSRAVRARFGLPEFTGQLFLHVVGAAGHDVVKYALDTFGDAREPSLSATHDANAWPADFYAGLPAPAPGETVTLWVQNSQPCPIPAGAIGLNLMGDARVCTLDRPLAPFATCALDVADLMPQARWPQQIEVRAGRYMVRPRYEVTAAASAPHRPRQCRAHRLAARSQDRRARQSPRQGLSCCRRRSCRARSIAPWRCPRRWRRPSASCRSRLPPMIATAAKWRASASAGCRAATRSRSTSIRCSMVRRCRRAMAMSSCVYDFGDGGEADGWLHGLFRYEHRASGHAAETSFGAHVFNTVLTYKGEPQSYVGRPPGLSTRLFLRLGQGDFDTLCHLIYPASTPWHGESRTDLVLHDRTGAEVARVAVAIACSGSLLWRYHEIFDDDARARAGEDAFVVVRDRTCRLFGYHGLLGREGAFSLDHMFGF